MAESCPIEGRRRLLVGAAATAVGWPTIVRAQTPLALTFTTIPDPDGWHPSLRLKGDWLIVEISDGILTGYGEASHSRDDAACRRAATELFDRYYRGFSLSLASLRDKETEIAPLAPDFITATAFSALNQALYDLLAKREGVPVWQLFRDRPGLESIALYTTINRALQERSVAEYLEMVDELAEQGFASFKCAPFEAVDSFDDAIDKSRAGLALLERLSAAYPNLGIRVDFHERFKPDDFYRLLPRLESMRLEWIEEPFAMGADYSELKRRTSLRVAGGELFWGNETFARLVDNAWVDVIMPDVKHVGGFGPLLDVIALGRGRVDVSPHNPAGPISTAASLHAAVVYPQTVPSIEYAFDRAGVRSATGETVDGGRLFLTGRPGWGVTPAIP